MKKNFWLIIGVLIAINVSADQAIVPVATEPPPARSTKKKPATHSTAKKAAELRTVPLVAGPATVAISPGSRVNVRGQPKLKSEIITRLTNGEPVTVVEEIQLKVSQPEEPSAWAKIVLPAAASPWVNASFVDQANMTVTAKKLNLRGGPGENYSVLGTLSQGATVKEISRKEGWIQIESPEPAHAYIAAQYLKQEPPPTEITSTEAVATSTTVVDTAVATTTTDTATGTTPTTDATATDMSNTNGGALTSSPIEETPPPPPRIVQREGIVRGTFSIQAPTKFELISAENRRTIDYLHTPSPDLDLSRYKGLRVVVSGEESLDERWKNTPVLTIQRIQPVGD